jgi:hypothetical protein
MCPPIRIFCTRREFLWRFRLACAVFFTSTKEADKDYNKSKAYGIVYIYIYKIRRISFGVVINRARESEQAPRTFLRLLLQASLQRDKGFLTSKQGAFRKLLYFKLLERDTGFFDHPFIVPEDTPKDIQCESGIIGNII